jgi:peptidoglycan/xylan/chitin deacetylase (PgdA/CDA1 family)
LGGDAVRTLVGRAVGTRGFARIVELAERIDRPRADALAVLMYHRVANPVEQPGLDPGLISASPPEFEAQMEYLARLGRVVSLDDILAARRGDAELPPGAIAITFDDAYRDFAEHAWPAIRSRSLPVTLFVPTGYPDQPEMTFWWDRLHHALLTTARSEVETPAGRMNLDGPTTRGAAFKLLRDRLKRLDDAEARTMVDRLADELDAPPPVHAVLGWNELRRLAREGVTMAPHTRTHAFLDQVSSEQARTEIARSRADLERELGGSPAAFAFPAGQHTDDVVEILRDEGFEVAFTTEPGVNDLRRADWLRLRRINVGRRSTLPLIRARLLSFAPRAAH